MAIEYSPNKNYGFPTVDENLQSSNAVLKDTVFAIDQDVKNLEDSVNSKTSIDDSTISTETSWSSSKINNEVSRKTEIEDSTVYSDKTWSSQKISSEVNSRTYIADNTVSSESTWSSQKINSTIDTKVSEVIDDTVTESSSTWSSQKITNSLSLKQDKVSYITASADVTVQANSFVFADTTGSAFTVTLPASPSIGDIVEIHDEKGNFGTNNLTVSGNGNNIMGAGSVTLSNANEYAKFIFGSSEWRKIV